MALTLSQLVNDYGSYSGNTLIGDLGSRASVPNSGFGDVRGVSYDNITFIVKVNGTKYASSKWLSEQQNGNPYLSSATVARIDSVNIPNPPLNFLDKGGEGEKYAEIKASSKLQSGDDIILRYINELLSPTDDIKPASSWGSWSGNVQRTVTVPTSIQDPLGNPYDIGVVGSKYGNTYNADIDLEGVYPGLEFEETGFDGKVSGAEALSSTVSVREESVKESSVDSGTVLEQLDTLGIVLDDIKIEPIKLDPIDIDFRDFDFGIGDINTNFGFGLGGDIPIGTNTNPLTNNNFSTQLSNSYSGYETDANDFNEPEIFGGFGF